MARLSKFHQSIVEVPHLGIRILSIPEALVESAALPSRQTDLLSNDALILALMRQHGLTKLATNDGVSALTRYAPV